MGQTLKGRAVTGDVSVRLIMTIMMMVFFSGLALDIAVPAVALTSMATLKWLVENWPAANDSSSMRKAETA
ncbi:hypothetical protein [Rhizobium sp. SL42]|uniref:hypothetical protein n=1 Tax=Rhizobium sp. SL42 TaxID=2806346 RepID=UPI001F27E564|nr:hypothetical protein [Rhizobium sp. SL42]